MFKINLSEKSGNTYHLEAEAEGLIEKKLNDKVDGKDVSPDLAGYEFEITGASDKSGFTIMENVEGLGLKKVLLTYGKAMKKRPRKEGKKKLSKNKPKGLRLRKTVRGNTISLEIAQINLKVIKEGTKKLAELFPEQCKAKEVKPEQAPKQEIKIDEKPVEQRPQEVKEKQEEEKKVEEVKSPEIEVKEVEEKKEESITQSQE